MSSSSTMAIVRTSPSGPTAASDPSGAVWTMAGRGSCRGSATSDVPAKSGKTEGMRFNVAIRTISLFDTGEAVFNAGGGIVFDSKAADEYAECLLKARFAIGNAEIAA